MERPLLLSIRTGVVLVLLIPLIVVDGSIFPSVFKQTLFPYIVGKALFARVVIEIVFALWILLAIRYSNYRLQRSWLLAAFAIYAVVSTLAALAGVSLQRSLWSTYERMQGVVDLIHWLALAVVVTSVFRTFARWRLLLNVNLALSLIVALMGVAEHYEAWPFEVYGSTLQRADRPDITLGNPTYVGAYMLVNVFIGLALLGRSLLQSQSIETVGTSPRRRRGRRSRRDTSDDWLTLWRLFWITTIALDLWMLTLSATRGASIGLAVGLLAAAVGYLLWGQKGRLKVASGVVVGAVLALVLALAIARGTGALVPDPNSDTLIGRLVNLGLDDKSVKGRVVSWSAGLEGFAARPFLGWGPDNYIVAWARYFKHDPAVTQTFDQAHNKPLEELTTKGALGFLSYIAIWGIMAWVVVRALKRTRAHEQLFILLIGAALVAYFVQNLFLFDSPSTVLQFILLLALVASLEMTMGAPEDASAQGRGAGPGELPWSRLESSTGTTGIGSRAGRSTGGSPFQSEQKVLYWAIGLVALSLVVVYFVNYGAYRGATTVIETTRPSISWTQRLGHFRDSIDSFPPLANYPRLILLNMVADNWHTLTAEDARKALVMAENEVRRAIEVEPESWRIRNAMTRLHQRASAQDPAYIESARFHLDRASELAPETREVRRLQEVQEALEEQQAAEKDDSGS